MPVVAQLENRIVGDDTNWRAAVLRTQASLESLQAQAAQSTAAIGTAFAGLSAPVNGISSTFATVGANATTSFNQVQAAAAVVPPSLAAISAEAQVVGAAVSSNGNARRRRLPR